MLEEAAAYVRKSARHRPVCCVGTAVATQQHVSDDDVDGILADSEEERHCSVCTVHNHVIGNKE